MPWFRSSCKFRYGNARVLPLRRTPLRPGGAPLPLDCGHCHDGTQLGHARAFDAHVCGERRLRCRRAGVFASGDGRGRLRQKLRHLAVLGVQDRLLGGRASSGTAGSTCGHDPARVGARERTPRCANHLHTATAISRHCAVPQGRSVGCYAYPNQRVKAGGGESQIIAAGIGGEPRRHEGCGERTVAAAQQQV